MSFVLAAQKKVGIMITEKRNKKLSPDPTSLDDLLNRLKNNKVKELSLGWRESNFVTNKRGAILLDKALKMNTSITSVSIGWRTRNRDILTRILRSITRNCKLTHLHLILDDWIPESSLRQLISMQTGLQSVNIQSVTVKRRSNITGRVCCGEEEPLKVKSNQHLHRRIMYNSFGLYQDDPNCDHCVASRVIVHTMYHHEALKELHLVDCGMTDAQAGVLADFLHIRGGIAELSLRNNRRLGAHGLRMICQAPVMQSLDLSLCDMESPQATAVAESIAARPWPLGKLMLCGNYRMGTFGLLSLMQQKVCNKVVSLNISYCDLDGYRCFLIFNALRKLSNTTTIRELYMQGAKAGDNMVSNELCLLLSQSSSLRVLKLNDPGAGETKKVMSPMQLRRVLDGLQFNYEMEELAIDFIHCTAEIQAWKEISFHLQLNRAGRRILVSKPPQRRYSGFTQKDDDDWFQVLANAGQNEDLNVLYWIVRQGAEKFAQRY